MRHDRALHTAMETTGQRRDSAFTDVLDTIFRQKALLVALFAALAVGLGAYLVLTPRTYDAQMSILVKSKRAEVLMSPNASQERPENSGFEALFATEVQMLTSQELLRSVVTACHLQRAGEDMDKTLIRLRKSLRVAPVLKSNLIQVTYTDIDPDRAAKVLRTLADGYLEKYIRVNSAPDSLQFFEKQASEAQAALDAAQQRLTAFQTKSEIVALNDQKDLWLKKLLELQSALREAEALDQENTQRMETFKTQLADAHPRINTQRRQISNQYSVERLTTLLVELQNRRTEMAAKFRPEDRLVKQLDQQISDTRRALEAARGSMGTEDTTDLNPLRQSLEADLSRAQSTASGLRGRIAALERQVRECRGQLARLGQATPVDQELLRAAQLAEENYLLYAKKREEARIAGEMDRKQMINVQLVDQPLAPLEPNGILRPAVVALALLGAVAILMLAFVVGNNQRVLNTPWEVDRSVDAPLLATVPLEYGDQTPAGEDAAAAEAGSSR